MALLYGRAGRLTTKNGGFRPGQYLIGSGIFPNKEAGTLVCRAYPASPPVLYQNPYTS
jgi:hypothetical protein